MTVADASLEGLGALDELRAEGTAAPLRRLSTGYEHTDSLPVMRKPGESQTMGVCTTCGCWSTANERGYWSPYQDRPE